MSPNPIIISPASSSDATLLTALGARTFRDAFAPDNDPTDLENYIAQAFTVEQIATELADPTTTFLLAWVGDEAVGYSKLKTGTGPACIVGESPVELSRLYLDQSVIGRGYGAALMTACFEKALEQLHDTLWLGVWEHNHRAKAFYQKWGFRTVGQHQFVLGQDVQTDELMMRPLSVNEAR